MDVLTMMKERRSVRDYLPKPVEPAKLTSILEGARHAPSARNLQNWKFVVVTDKKKIMLLKEACNGQEFIAKAPVFIAICATDYGGLMACGMPRHIMDATIAMTHLILAAKAEGLGTCWVGSFKQDEVKKILGVPPEASVVAVTPLGYPAGAIPPKPRKTFEEVVSYETF